MEPLLLEAIVSALNLFLNYKNCNNNKLDQQVRLNTLRENSWLSGEEKVGLINSAEILTGMQIIVQEFPPLNDSVDPIYAMLNRYEDKAKVYVSENENFCHLRFYTAKELCHLLMDKGDDDSFTNTTSGIIKLISDLQSTFNGSMLSNGYPAYDSEICAYWAACELLLPPEFTEKADEILSSGSADSLRDAAMYFRVPKKIIEQRYLDKSTRDLFDEVHNDHQYQTVSLRPAKLGPKQND